MRRREEKPKSWIIEPEKAKYIPPPENTFNPRTACKKKIGDLRLPRGRWARRAARRRYGF